MMHTALGVEKEIGQTGVLHAIVAWTKPFRMPDFFLLSGYLTAGLGALNWRLFVDRKLLRYLYFYVLWLLIITLLKSGTASLLDPAKVFAAFAFGLIEPFSSLWFIYVLPFFMLTARLAKGKLACIIAICAIFVHLWAMAYPVGDAYAMASQATPSTAINSFALFLVFFLAGFFGRRCIDVWLEASRRRLPQAAAMLILWVLLHSYSLHLGLTGIPGLTLLFGMLGGLAVAVLALLLERASSFGWLAYCGRHSLPIYLAFVVFMASSRELLVASGKVTNPNLLMALVLAFAICGPLVLERVVKDGAFHFLFSRPGWARLPGTMGGV